MSGSVRTYSGRNTNGVARVIATLLVLGTPAAALAQSAPTAERTARLDIAAQPLGSALAAWSSATGIRIQSLPQAAGGAPSPGVRGELTAIAALDALLRGTGYSFRFSRVDAVVIEPIPAAGTSDLIGTVRVQGTAAIATQGVNGSTDPTATEGSDSYAADQTMVATKTPLPLKDTPQTVSVVTSQQLADRNVTNLQQALTEGPGVSVVYGDSGGVNDGRSNLQPSFYARGFEIKRLLVDGGAPVAVGSQAGSGSLVPQINMAAYDHIEILRGADGLFDGSGDPGGVVNLTRKRPLDRQQLLVSQLFESWNGFNTMIDGSSPIGFGGNLRARVVLNRQSNDYFYDTASNKQFLIYATLEAQLTPKTVVTVGINYQTQNTVPFFNGLLGGIRNGQAIDLDLLPRSTCFCFSSNRQSFDTREVFGRIEQSFGGDWKLKINGSATRQVSDFSYRGVIGTVGSVDPYAQPRLTDSYGHAVSTQYQVDGSLAGSFMLFGQKQWLVLGGNYSSFDGGGALSYTGAYLFGGPAIDPFHFDPADYPEPARSGLPSGATPINRTENLGAYGTLRISPVKRLHLTMGMRYNRYSGHNMSYNICRSDFGCYDFNTNVFVGNGDEYGRSDVRSSTGKFFPAGYLAVAFDILPTLSLYASKTAIYIDNSLLTTVDEKPMPPTTGNNFEGGLKYASADHRLTASATGFYLKQSGTPLGIGTAGNPNANPVTGKLPDGRNCCFIDAGTKKESWGADIEIAGEILTGMQVSASYVYNKTRSSTPGGDAESIQSQSPEHLYKAWAKYTFQPGSALKGGYIGVGVQGQSAGFVSSPICTLADEFGCIGSTRFTARLAPRALLSVLGGWAFDSRFSIAVTINNLLDKHYFNSVGLIDGGNWYGAPRNISVSLRSAF